MNLCHRLFCLSLFGAICGLAQAAAPRHSLALPPVSVPPVGEFVVPSEMPAQAEITRLPAELIVQFQTEVLAKASSQALAQGTADATFHETKLATGRYYMARQLPATMMHLARIQSGAEPVMALAADRF